MADSKDASTGRSFVRGSRPPSGGSSDPRSTARNEALYPVLRRRCGRVRRRAATEWPEPLSSRNAAIGCSYIDGASREVLAEHHGLVVSSVKKILWRLQIPLRPRRHCWKKRFWSYVEIGLPGECWPWVGATGGSSAAYGVFGFTGDNADYAHRIAFSIFCGPIEDGVVIRHTCDNPPCCNPSHLLPGSHQDNVDDMVFRGRNLFGERHPKATMTDEIALSIMSSHGQIWDGKTRCAKDVVQALMDQHGVGRGAVLSLLDGRTWRHLPRPAHLLSAVRESVRVGESRRPDP